MVEIILKSATDS